MEGATELTGTGKIKTELVQFKESFETFNKIINNLQRQYLSLEKEYSEQGRRLEEINRQLRRTIRDNREMTFFLNSILTSLTSGVVAVDTSGTISHFNPAAERITGIQAARALGKKYNDVIAAKSGANCSALDTVLSGAEYDSEEKIFLGGSNEEIPVSVSTSRMLDDGGNCYGAVEIFFDLTKMKKLEAEVNRVQTLAALGEMAATVAHEVRNPLGGIGGFASLLRREVEDDEAKVRLVDKIIAGVESLNRTISALLDYTRRDQLNLRTVSLKRLIEDTAEYERADSESNGGDIAISIHINGGDIDVTCDPHLMRQVLLNLLRNARESIPKAGKITLQAGIIAENDSSPLPPPGVWITVKDTGAGIREEFRDKIFRPFFSTKSDRRGSGLGLASVWKIMQSHGGKIAVDSEVGAGSVFTLYLPGAE